MSCILSEDRALLDRFRRGERDALGRVFSHYAPHVASLLKSGFGFNAGNQRIRFGGYGRVFELEDALQETFKRAFSERARMSYDGLRPYAGYIAVIARNLVIDQYTSRRRELLHFTFDDSDSPELDDSGAVAIARPEREALDSELRTLVASFRADLDEREQTVFTLRFDEGLSHAAITEQTGLSASQLKTTEAKLRTSLLKHLKRHGYLDGHSARVTPLANPTPSGENQ
jgi:RNA polymerase sigma factor (sigma-70 family)